MKLWPQTIFVRLVVALMIAALAIVVLDQAVAAWEAKPVATRRAAGPGAAWIEAPAAARRSGLGFRLQSTSGTIVLARRLTALAPDVAPVVEILADGQLVLRRPRPLATGPGTKAPLSSEGHGAGVLLPVDGLVALPAAARGALVGLLQQWVVERPVSVARIASADVELPVAALRRLLAWVP